MMLVFLFTACIGLCLGQPELFKNPDFEQPFDEQNNWWCNVCTLDKSTDAYQGRQSGRVTNRYSYSHDTENNKQP